MSNRMPFRILVILPTETEADPQTVMWGGRSSAIQCYYTDTYRVKSVEVQVLL